MGSEPVHSSVWLDEPLIETQPLASDMTADVCIVGAGITGLLTAVKLAAEGLSVVMLDAGAVAGGETSRTTAHAVTALDDRYARLEHLHGQSGAKLAAESHAQAISFLEGLVMSLGIDCEFLRVDGYLVVDPKHAARACELIEGEYDACRRVGLVNVECVTRLPAGWPTSWDLAIRFRGQAQFDPMRLVRGLVGHLMGRGVQIYTSTHAAKIQGGSDAHVVTRAGPVVRAGRIVVATNTPVNDLVVIHTKQAGYQSYVVALEIPAGAVSPALLWDGFWEDDEAYHYVRLRHGGLTASESQDVLIVGGEDHKTGQGHNDLARYERLETWAREHFPMAGRVVTRWSGEVMEPIDGLGYIGHNPLDNRNVYIATGDSGNGMTHGAIAAMLLTDLIIGRENPWANLYDPARKIGINGLGDYVREAVNMVSQYGDWFKGGSAPSEAEIAPGAGAVVSHGLKKLAVYKDECGRCTRLSAVCTHLGGIVRWNALEGTWDCPCHASRFDRMGHVIHGPAVSDLKPADPEGTDGVTVRVREEVGVGVPLRGDAAGA